MSRALVSVMLFVMIVSSTFLTIGIGTQNTYPIPFLSIVDIVSMDSNASPQHLFATYVAGRIVEMNASQLPFLQNIDPRYLHALIYDGKEFIEIPMRIYTKVIHFNPGSLLSGKLYVVPKKMNRATVIDIKLPPIYPKSLDAEALNKLPIYLKGSILYPTTIAIRLENGREVSFPIIFAIAKVRNIEIAKNSIDYDNVVEDFELYGVGGFYQKLLELVRKGIAVDIRRTIEQYTNTVLKAGIESIEQPIDLSNENVPQWNVVEFVAPFKTWSINCTNYPCTIYPWFQYRAYDNESFSGTLTELIVYRIEVEPLENQGGSPPGSTPTSTPTVTSSYTTVTTSSTFSTTHSTTFTSTSSRSVTSTTSRSTSTSVTSTRRTTTSITSTTIRTSTTTHSTTITSPTSTTHTTSTTTMITTRPSITWTRPPIPTMPTIPTFPTVPPSWPSRRKPIEPLGTFSSPTNEITEATLITTQLCKLVVKYYTNGSWYQQTYYIDPNTNNLIWFEWYFPNDSEYLSRVDVELEQCSRSMVLQVESVAVAHYIPNIESSVLSNKTLDLYPLGSPNTSYKVGAFPYSEMPIRIDANDPDFVAISTLLQIPILQALLYRFADQQSTSYELEFMVALEDSSMDALLQICIGSTCSDVIDVAEGEMFSFTLKPEDILSYYEALRNLPVTISIWKQSETVSMKIIHLNAPIKILARPMTFGINWYQHYESTTTYKDEADIWKDTRYLLRGGSITSYVVRQRTSQGEVLEGFVLRTVFSSISEFVQGSYREKNMILTVDTMYSSIPYTIPSRPDLPPDLYCLSLYNITIEVRNEGIKPGTTYVQVRLHGPGAPNIPDMIEIPPPLSLLISLLGIPSKVFGILGVMINVYTIWCDWVRYVLSPSVSEEIGYGFVRCTYRPPPAYIDKTYLVNIEIRIDFIMNVYDRVVKVVHRIVAGKQDPYTGAYASIETEFSDSFILSILTST